MTYEDILTKMKKQVIKEALDLRIINEDELPKYVGKYYDEFGIDSFVNYLSYLIHLKGHPVSNDNIFMTLNHNLLKDKEKLEKRFKLKIETVGETWKRMSDKLRDAFEK